MQVGLLNCQPIILGYLSQYFAQLGTLDQGISATSNNTDCSPSPQLQVVSTRDAYLFALDEILYTVFSSQCHVN